MDALLAQVEARYKTLRPAASVEDLEALRYSVKGALRDVFLHEIGRRVKAESISAILFAPREGEDDDSG